MIKEELSELERVSSTVNLLQKHVSSLKENNIALQKKCSDLELSIDNNEHYSRRTCLRITNIPCEEKETSEEVLKKEKTIKEEAEVYTPEETIDRAHRVGPKKNKNQAIIVNFSTFRHRTLFYRTRKKLSNGIKLHTDLTKKRFNLLLDVQSFTQGKENVKYVNADINCNWRIRLVTMVKKSFVQRASWKVCFQSNHYHFLFFLFFFFEVILS